MAADNKFMDMLVNYASAHQHKINVLFHLIGIPTIMLGIYIPLSWISYEVIGITFSAAHLVTIGLFFFYFTLDTVFSLVFLIMGLIIAEYALILSTLPMAGTIAAAAFFGGYAASKVAVRRLADTWRGYLKKYNIQVTTICPGYIKSELTDINEFDMPFLMDTDVAANKMVKAIDKGKKTYILPWQWRPVIFISNILGKRLLSRI